MFNISVDPGGLLKNKDAEIVRLTSINFWEFNGNTDITLILVDQYEYENEQECRAWGLKIAKIVGNALVAIVALMATCVVIN
jgi:hypothetical protein